MTADQYLSGILTREAVNTGVSSPVLAVQNTLIPVLREWGGHYLQDVHPSGSFAKGTANHSGTDIDLFVSVAQSGHGLRRSLGGLGLRLQQSKRRGKLTSRNTLLLSPQLQAQRGPSRKHVVDVARATIALEIDRKLMASLGLQEERIGVQFL